MMTRCASLAVCIVVVGGCSSPPEQDPIFGDSPTAAVSEEQIDHWESAWAWGDHHAAGYLSAEADPLFGASPAAQLTTEDLNRWNAASGWGDHATAGYLASEEDPKVGMLGPNAVPRWNGVELTGGLLTDTGASVGVGTRQPRMAFEVHGPSGAAVLDQAQPTGGNITTASEPFTQTFKAALSGSLVAVELSIGGPWPFVLELLSGDGETLGATTCLGEGALWFACRFPTPPSVTAGGSYALRIQPTGGHDVEINMGSANPYPDGVLSLHSDYDLKFRTWVAPTTSAAALEVGTVVNVKTLLHLTPMSEPGAAQPGDVYFDAGLKRLRFYDGAAWVTL